MTLPLSPAQLDAVSCGDGNILIESGPGTGKTAMLAARRQHLRALGVPSERILCLTPSRETAHDPLPEARTFAEFAARGRRLTRSMRAVLLEAARASVGPPLPRATETLISTLADAPAPIRARLAASGGVRLRAAIAAAEKFIALRRDLDLVDCDDLLARETLAAYEHLLIDDLQELDAQRLASLAHFTGTIFATASALPERVTRQLHLSQLAPAPLDREPVASERHVAQTPFDEAAFVAQRIAAEIATGTPPARIAATARTIEPSGRLLHAALQRLGIPADLRGERCKTPGILVRTVLDGLRALDRPDDAARWHDFLRQPVFGYPPLPWARALLHAPPHSLDDALALLDERAFPARLPHEQTARTLRDAQTSLRHGKASAAARTLARGLDLLGFALANDPESGRELGAALDTLDRLEDLRAKIGASDTFSASLLADFERHAEQLGNTHDEPSPNAVRILPIKALAGQRFDLLVLLDAADGRFPTETRRDAFLDDEDLALARSLDYPLDTTRDEHFARERTLWSLAVTRAQQRLIVTHARVALDETPLGPSRFLSPEQRRALATQTPYRAPHTYHGAERVPLLAPAQPVPLPQHIAVTRLDDWLRCERRFFFSAIARLASESAYRATFGTCLHATLEAFHTEHRVFEDPDSVTRWSDALVEHRRIIWSDRQARFASNAERDAAAFAADRLLRSYARSLGDEARRTPFAVDAIERTVSLEMNGMELRGKIDRVDRLPDGSARIVDFKTGRFRQKASKGLEALANALERDTLRTANEPPSIASPQLLLYRRAIPEASVTTLIFLGGDDDGATTIDELPFEEHRTLIDRVDAGLARDFGTRLADPPSFFAPTKNARTCQNCAFASICDGSLAAEAEG